MTFRAPLIGLHVSDLELIFIEQELPIGSVPVLEWDFRTVFLPH